jgi:hypothetical protein
MSETDDSLHEGPRAVFERAQSLFLEKDMDGFADLFAPDGVHELPFAPPGVPPYLKGRESIREYLTAITATPIEFHEFQDLTIHESTDAETLVAEYVAIGVVVSTGEPYRTRYIQVLQVRKGQILLWRDYWSPLPGAQALGRLSQLFHALTGENLH